MIDCFRCARLHACNQHAKVYGSLQVMHIVRPRMDSMPRKRKIFVLSGKRGGFGAMLPMLRLLEQHADCELQLVLTDQHLNPQFGQTESEVNALIPVTATVDMEQAGDSGVARAQSLARCLSRITEVLSTCAPDMVVLYGDRGESIVTALAALHLGIPIAHLQGGDVSGSLDDLFRHAITKLAHLHFVSNDISASRVAAMAEQPERIHIVGDSHLDVLLHQPLAPATAVAAKFNLDVSRPIIIVLQHSETTEVEQSYQQMCTTLRAVAAQKMQTVIVYPCSDAGYAGIIKAVNEYRNNALFQVHKNIETKWFHALMSVATVLVGNSSAGIIEAAYVALPAVNIGRRQEGRSAPRTVIHVSHNEEEISAAIVKASTDNQFRQQLDTAEHLYGDGCSAAKIVDVLLATPLDDEFFRKRLCLSQA